MQSTSQRTNFRIYDFPVLPAAVPSRSFEAEEVLAVKPSCDYEVTEWKQVMDVQKTFNPITWTTVVPVPMSPPPDDERLGKFPCPVPGCDKSYKRRCRVVEHVKLRHNPEGVARFQCKVEGCLKSYCRLDALRMHHRTERHGGVIVSFETVEEANNRIREAKMNSPSKKPKIDKKERTDDLPVEPIDVYSKEPVEVHSVATTSQSIEPSDSPGSPTDSPRELPGSPPRLPPAIDLAPPSPSDCSRPTLIPSSSKPVFRIIDSERPFRFHCKMPDCAKSYSSRYRYTVHMKEAHGSNSERPFTCPVESCQKAYATKESLKRHKKKAGHIDENEEKRIAEEVEAKEREKERLRQEKENQKLEKERMRIEKERQRKEEKAQEVIKRLSKEFRFQQKDEKQEVKKTDTGIVPLGDQRVQELVDFLDEL